MEMKYIKEQDTGQIYMPVVHVTGIVGLDVSSTTTRMNKEIRLADTTTMILDGSIRFTEYNKVVISDIVIDLDTDTMDHNSVYYRLLNGNTVTIDISTAGLKPYTYLVYDTIAYNELYAISSLIDVGCTYSNGVISINASLKDNQYYKNELGEPYNQITDLKLTRIAGYAVGMIKN